MARPRTKETMEHLRRELQKQTRGKHGHEGQRHLVWNKTAILVGGLI